MFYQKFIPIKPLQQFIRYIWVQEFTGKVVNMPEERIIPDCCIELVIHFHEPFQTIFPNNLSEVQPQSFIIAQMKDYIEIMPRGKIGMIGVRFYPWGIYHFLNHTIKEIKDRVIDSSLLLGQEVKILEEKIYHAKSNPERVKIVEKFLLKYLKNNSQKFELSDYGLWYIYKLKGKVTIKQLVDYLGFSRK